MEKQFYDTEKDGHAHTGFRWTQEGWKQERHIKENNIVKVQSSI